MKKIFNKTTISFIIVAILSITAGNRINTTIQESNPERVSETLKKIDAEKTKQIEKQKSIKKDISDTKVGLSELALVKNAVSKDSDTIEKEKQKLDDTQLKIDKAEQAEQERKEKAEAQQKQKELERQEQAKRDQAAAKQNSTNQGGFNTATDGQGQIIGNSRSKIYHVPGQAAYHINPENIVTFNSEAEAIAAGYRKSAR